MHHDNRPMGCIRVSPPLNEDEIDALLDLAESGRTLRSTPTGRGNPEVPFARVAWEVCLDGCCLWWTGDEESRWVAPSLEFLVEHWFRRGAAGETHPKFADFTFDHVLEGVVVVRGPDGCTVVEARGNAVSSRLVPHPCESARTPEPEAHPLPANVVELRPRRA